MAFQYSPYRALPSDDLVTLGIWPTVQDPDTFVFISFQYQHLEQSSDTRLFLYKQHAALSTNLEHLIESAFIHTNYAWSFDSRIRSSASCRPHIPSLEPCRSSRRTSTMLSQISFKHCSRQTTTFELRQRSSSTQNGRRRDQTFC